MVHKIVMDQTIVAAIFEENSFLPELWEAILLLISGLALYGLIGCYRSELVIHR